MAPTLFGGIRNSAIATPPNFAWPFFTLFALSLEASRVWPVRISGSFGRWTINIDATATARQSAFRKNSADSIVNILPLDGTSGKFQYPGADHWAVGDTFDVNDAFTGATGFTLLQFSGVFTADAGTVGFGNTPNTSTGTGGPFFGSIGALWTNNFETGSRHFVRAPFTARGMIAGIQANTNTSSLTLISRKNSANGAMSVAIPAGAIGVFEDTTNSDSLVSGDTWGVQLGSIAVGSITITVGVTLNYASRISELPVGDPSFSFNTAAQFCGIMYTSGVNLSESGRQQQMNIDGKLSNMRCNLFTNSMTSAFALNIRKNGVTGNQAISIPATSTGTFEDTTRSDLFLAADVMNLMGTGGTAGTIVFAGIATTLTPFSNAHWQRQRHFLRR